MADLGDDLTEWVDSGYLNSWRSLWRVLTLVAGIVGRRLSHGLRDHLNDIQKDKAAQHWGL